MTTLSFSTHFPERTGGKPTNFVGKIWQGLLNEKIATEGDINNFVLNANEYQLNIFDFRKGQYTPKLHTIRHDTKNRWKVGSKIHMVVFNRTKNRFQFTPVLEVKSIQKIEIDWIYEEHANVFIDEREDPLLHEEVETLALSDGFDSVEQFFEWFNEDFHGKIIHWTGLKY